MFMTLINFNFETLLSISFILKHINVYSLLQLVYQLTLHEDEGLAETAEHVYKKFQCLFAVPWGRSFMDVFMEQARERQAVLKNVSAKARKIIRKKCDRRKCF